MRRRRIGNRDPIRRPPQPLQCIECSAFRAEDVDDEVEVVEQNPSRFVAAFDVRGFHALRRERFPNRVRDRMNLSGVLPGHDDEVVGEAVGRPEVEHDDVACFAVVAGVDGALHLRRKFLRCAFAWRSHWTAATGAGT